MRDSIFKNNIFKNDIRIRMIVPSKNIYLLGDVTVTTQDSTTILYMTVCFINTIWNGANQYGESKRYIKNLKVKIRYTVR